MRLTVKRRLGRPFFFVGMAGTGKSLFLRRADK
jgi:MoxR-like ATPase